MCGNCTDDEECLISGLVNDTQVNDLELEGPHSTPNHSFPRLSDGCFVTALSVALSDVLSDADNDTGKDAGLDPEADGQANADMDRNREAEDHTEGDLNMEL